MSTPELEALEPSAPTYEVDISGYTFVQKPLTFFGKIELFSILAETVERALSEGATISEFLDDVPQDFSSPNQLKESDLLVKGLASIVKYSPEILKDIFCISLQVKRSDREYVKDNILDELSDDEAMKILNNFIDQNWDAVLDFFKERVSPLIQNVSERLQSPSTSSKPSKASRQRTPKA